MWLILFIPFRATAFFCLILFCFTILLKRCCQTIFRLCVLLFFCDNMSMRRDRNVIFIFSMPPHNIIVYWWMEREVKRDENLNKFNFNFMLHIMSIWRHNYRCHLITFALFWQICFIFYVIFPFLLLYLCCLYLLLLLFISFRNKQWYSNKFY